MTIREETPADYDAVRQVNRLAFNTDLEARLVDRLRADGLAIASLVAVVDGRIAGHIFFSPVRVERDDDGPPLRAASLAPMAVRPELQRRGVGSALVRRGLELCRERDESIAVVLGHAAYYPRFGFSAALARSLRNPFLDGTSAAWMALELRPGALAGVSGTVRYPPVFDELGG